MKDFFREEKIDWLPKCFTKFDIVYFKRSNAQLPWSYGSIQAGTATTKASKSNIRVIGDLKLFDI